VESDRRITLSQSEQSGDEFEINLGSMLGAEQDAPPQVLTLYILDQDRENSEIGTQRRWVLEA
jgi:hypothetical protein